MNERHCCPLEDKKLIGGEYTQRRGAASGELCEVARAVAEGVVRPARFVSDLTKRRRLIPTELVELFKYRTDLLTFFGIRIQFAQLLSQRDKFRT
jgi:hypothetical protein